MKPPEPGPLSRLADAVNDGVAVDWELEATNQPELRPALDCLKLLAAISSGYRSLPVPPPAPPAIEDSPPRGRRERSRPRGPAARARFTWGPLRVIEPIGSGSFGDVFRAFDPTLERDVALKLWRHGPASSRDRLLTEARRLARVRHPNVLVVHGADEYDGRAGMWTDLILGRSLEQCLAEQGPWGPGEAAAAGIELCRALAALHAARLVHRDVKTTNVMREHGGRIVLMDFGAAGELTARDRVGPGDGLVGTPLTLAPEQLEGAPATTAADLYSLGVLLYRLVSGAYPVEAETLDELRENHRRGARVPLRDRRADLPADFVRAIERALEPLATRHAGAGAMERALADCLGAGVPAAAPRRTRRAQRSGAEAGRSAASGAVPHNLPETFTRFLGRESDLADCVRRCGPGRWLTLAGPAGCGKTRLALRLAEILLPEFPDGVRFVDLEGLEDPGRFAERVAAAGGRRGRGDARGIAELADGLRGSRLLCVLDHADAAGGAVAAFAAACATSCPGLGVIATCRAPVGAPGETVHVLAEPATFAAAQESTREPAAPPYVGREEEMARLIEDAGSARRSSGRTILIAGEAGLGKSRLMEEFRRRAEAAGFLCLAGRCSYGSGRNFEPFVEALEEFARRFAPAAAFAPADDVADASGDPGFAGLNAVLDTRRRLVPEPRNREQVWFVLDAWLKRIARHETLVLFLDDLHWADEGAVSLLNHVTRNSGHARVLVVGSYRPEDVAAMPQDHPVRDVLRLLSASARVRTLPLARLDETQSAALARAMLAGSGLDPGHAARVHERAQGHPFFTIEMVRLLAESSGAAAPAADAPLPRTVTDVVLRRLARLERGERDLLDLAAVEGERFASRTLETVTRAPRLEVLKQLRALERDHHLIVATEDGHRFSHGLIRDVLLREMPAELRREYHGVVADHLIHDFGDRPDCAARIAEQLAAAGRHADAAPRFVAAAREALRLFLYERAVELLDRALEAPGGDGGASRGAVLRMKCEVLLRLGRPHRAREAAAAALAADEARGDEASRIATLEALGEAALAQGDVAAAESFLGAARAHHAHARDPGPLARCDRKLGAAAARRGDFAGALARLEGALDCLGAPGDELDRARIRLDVGDVLYRRGDFELALATFEAAVASLRRLDERTDLARGLNLLGNAWFQRGDSDRALERYREAMTLAIGLDDHQSIARIRANLGNIHLVRGDTEQARTQYEAALVAFESIGDRAGAGRTLMALGNVWFMRERHEEAAGYYRDSAARREEIGDRVGWANSLDNLGLTEYHLGRLDGARTHLETAMRLRTELGDRPGCVESAINLGALNAVVGDVETADRRFADAARAAGELGDARKGTRALLSRACLRLWAGDLPGCTAAVGEAEALGVADPALRARAFLLRGLATPPDAGREEWLRRAHAAASASGSPSERATARLALADFERDAGRWEAAAAGVAEALELAAAGPLPLIELHALRRQLALETRGEPAGAGADAVARRLETLVASLRSASPAGAAASLHDRGLFPLP